MTDDHRWAFPSLTISVGLIHTVNRCNVQEICWRTSPFAQMSFLSDRAALRAFPSSKDALWTSAVFLCCRHKAAENEWRCYHRYLLQKSLSSTFFVRPHHWKVIWQLVRGAEDRMDERRASLGHCLCFKAVWETARGEEFISSSGQSGAKTIADLWEEFKGIISKEPEDDSHRWDCASQIPRRYWGELISQESREPLQLRRQHQVQG